MTDAEKSQFRAELERVLSSDAIRHSTGLRRLLSYLAEQSLAGSAGDLKEYTIGVDAFAKPADYDPQLDPAVRVLAGKLRHKLENYYLKQGADDPVRIELPKGHFELKFRLHSGRESSTDDAALRGELRQWRRVSIVLAVCTILVAVLGGYWRLSPGPVTDATTTTGPLWTPELESIWRPYVESNRPTLITLGAPLFTKFSGGFFRSPRINDQEAAAASPQVRRLQQQLESSYAVPWYGFTGIGEANGAFLLGKLLSVRLPNLHLQNSSGLTWEDLQRNNVVFLGSPKFNVQVNDLPGDGDFVIRGGSIINLNPRPGEQAVYGDRWGVTKDILLEDYALISRSPGLHGRGEITILASSASQGTWAAVQYVTQPVYARDLVNRIQGSAEKLPGTFQVLIRVRFQDQVPVEISYVTHRVPGEPDS